YKPQIVPTFATVRLPPRNPYRSQSTTRAPARAAAIAAPRPAGPPPATTTSTSASTSASRSGTRIGGRYRRRVRGRRLGRRRGGIGGPGRGCGAWGGLGGCSTSAALDGGARGPHTHGPGTLESREASAEPPRALSGVLPRSVRHCTPVPRRGQTSKMGRRRGAGRRPGSGPETQHELGERRRQDDEQQDGDGDGGAGAHGSRLPWRRPGDGGARWDQGDRIRGLETALGRGRPPVERQRGKAVGVHEEDELRGLGVAVRVHPPYGARLIAEADLDRA